MSWSSSLEMSQQASVTLLDWRWRAVDVGFHLADKRIQVGDAAQHDRNRCFRETGLQRKCVAREDIAALIGAPVKKILITQAQQLAHQSHAVFDLIDVDVCSVVMREDTEADGLIRGHPDHNFQAVRIRQSFFQNSYKVEGLLLALPE